MPTIVALIPARGGSMRVPRKNIKPLLGKPLLCWTIEAAQQAGCFTEVVVSTEDAEIAAVATRAGARVHLREAWLAKDDAPDIGWVVAALSARREDAFALLRPTSPFRTPNTIQRAWQTFLDQQPCDSLRAVQRVREHPGKMWTVSRSHVPGGTSANPAIGSAIVRDRMRPVLPWSLVWRPGPGGDTHQVPWHSSPTQTLPEVYVQNASLEIAWKHMPLPPALAVAGTYGNDGTIAGDVVTPFFTIGWEGFDINTPNDWALAEEHAASLISLAPV